MISETSELSMVRKWHIIFDIFTHSTLRMLAADSRVRRRGESSALSALAYGREGTVLMEVVRMRFGHWDKDSSGVYAANSSIVE